MFIKINLDYWLIGFLSFLRIFSLIFSLPFFGESSVPISIKVLFSMSLTFFFLPIIYKSSYGSFMTWDIPILFTLAIQEIAFGLTLGWLCKLTFEGIVISAHLAGFQMGFGSSNLFFPGMDSSGTHPFTFFHRIIVVLIFFSLDLHQIFINALFQSFELVPLGKFFLSDLFGEYIIKKTGAILAIGLKMASPITVALLFSMSALGLVARAVPQINIFSVSFTLNFFLGLCVYLLMLPFFPSWLQEYYLSEGALWIQNISAWRSP